MFSFSLLRAFSSKVVAKCYLMTSIFFTLTEHLVPAIHCRSVYQDHHIKTAARWEGLSPSPFFSWLHSAILGQFMAINDKNGALCFLLISTNWIRLSDHWGEPIHPPYKNPAIKHTSESQWNCGRGRTQDGDISPLGGRCDGVSHLGMPASPLSERLLISHDTQKPCLPSRAQCPHQGVSRR